MNILLIFFNDPFCYWKDKLGIAYPLCQSLMESLLIASMLFFWLLLVHAIAYQDMVISIDPQSFFLPKAIISCTFLIYLVIMRLFVYIKYSQDPFFDRVQAQHLSNFYRILLSIGIILISCYSLYFGMITYRALKFIKNLKETYRYSIGTTIVVMSISTFIMVRNG